MFCLRLGGIVAGFLFALEASACSPAAVQPGLPLTTPTLQATMTAPRPTLPPAPSLPPAPTPVNALTSPTTTARLNPSPTPSDCPVLPVGSFNALWQNTPGLRPALGCPSSHHPRIAPDAWQVKTSYQPFEHGAALWSSAYGWYSQPTIFVINADSTYAEYEDHFDPKVDSAGGTEKPPAGKVEPTLGIGKVWRENANVRSALGWAASPESPGTGRFEMYMFGNMLWSSQTNKTYVFLSITRQAQVFDVPFTAQ